ncbi:glycyl-tRNA synthetase subunit beta [Clostridiales bacterium PH28_bin88]|nr:glycyl-tRNA synthetase subunit beta [Clostridiales bacterium PH28_bin88]
MAKDLLLEIGTEEIPARFMSPALSQLKELAEKGLAARRLDYRAVATYGTPRRLALLVSDLEERQRDLVEEVKGPAAKVAFDAQGNPTKAAEGFARGQGVPVSALTVKETPAGAYVFATKKLAGGPAAGVLPEFLLEVIAGLNFPKPMRWGYLDMRFARPIKWLVALFGPDVVDLELAGLRSGRLTRGHRFLGSQEIEIREPGDYLPRLEENYVIADQERRREIIWQQIVTLAAQEGGLVQEDEELLEEVTHLLEYPTALCGGFDSSYLELPQEVLITPMREHQRYFPVWGPDGRLLPKFITVRNGTAESLDTVRQGNEKVLKARLADAAFFYQEDLKEPLADKVVRLQPIVFQESLGTMYQKVERIQALAGYLARAMGLPPETEQDAIRCAYLAKADLVTGMVYEFPELQGIMGAYYAAHAGEKESVSRGIREHYQPRFAGDALPETPVGKVVAIADKIDTIVGCFAVGIQPTGSQDPYALRRQALGISHILLSGEHHLSLRDLVTAAYRAYDPTVRLQVPLEQVIQDVGAFFRQRLENIFEEKGFRYDVVNAVLAAGWDDPTDAYNRAGALAAFREDPGFDALLTAFNRAANLAQKAEARPVDPAAFVEAVEGQLYQAFSRVQAETGPRLAAGQYLESLRVIATIRQPIDDFFAGVMVMVEDERVRNNRLAMLKAISDYIAAIADLSKIVP